jgi:hypothetical protein
MCLRPSIAEISPASLLVRLCRCFLALVMMLFVGVVHPAHADEGWGFVQITCAPELGYFAIRRFFVMDLPHMGPYLTEGLNPGPDVVAALQRNNGIFDSERLQSHPFDCSIPSFRATQGWNNGRPGYQARVVGHLDKVADVISPYAEVFLQGKHLGNIFLNGGGSIDSIEVWYDVALEVRTCRTKPEISTDNSVNVVCRYELFKADAR